MLKSLKRRIEKLEEEVMPPRMQKIEIISYVPNFPSMTILAPITRRKR